MEPGIEFIEAVTAAVKDLFAGLNTYGRKPEGQTGVYVRVLSLKGVQQHEIRPIVDRWLCGEFGPDTPFPHELAASIIRSRPPKTYSESDCLPMGSVSEPQEAPSGVSTAILAQIRAKSGERS